MSLKISEESKIPTEPTPTLVEAFQLTKRRGINPTSSSSDAIDMLGPLRDVIFQLRPIWIRTGLTTVPYANVWGDYALVQAIGQVAYRVATPSAWQGLCQFVLHILYLFSIYALWSGCYVRFGYDPRQHPISRWLQVCFA